MTTRPRCRRNAALLTQIKTRRATSNHNRRGFYGDGFAPLLQGSLLGLGVRAAHPFFSPAREAESPARKASARHLDWSCLARKQAHRPINHTISIVIVVEVGYILTYIK